MFLVLSKNIQKLYWKRERNKMNWLTNFVKPKLSAIRSKIVKKENLWEKCPACQQMIFYREIKEKLYVCSNCNFHLNMPIVERLKFIYDNAKYEEIIVEKVIEDHKKAQEESLKMVYDQLKEAQNDLKYLDDVN